MKVWEHLSASLFNDFLRFLVRKVIFVLLRRSGVCVCSRNQSPAFPGGAGVGGIWWSGSSRTNRSIDDP